jgi:cytidylate kinase
LVKKMAIVTISRQMGSLGGEIASLVAEQLGFRLVWRELINQAARRSGAPEAALAAIDELGLLDMSPSAKAYRAYRAAVKQVIDELAAEGNCVILGRAGQILLKDVPGCLHVRLVAPDATRAGRVAQRLKIPIEAAQAQIKASDLSRSRYLKRFYRVRWDDPELYDLVINTAYLTPDTAAGLICKALHERLSPLTLSEAPLAGALN